MPVPQFNRNITAGWRTLPGDGLSCGAPSLLGASGSPGSYRYNTSNHQWGPDVGGTHAAATWYGGRVDLGTGNGRDLSAGDYVLTNWTFEGYAQFILTNCGYTLAAGGNVRFILEDGSGNYIGWVIAAGDTLSSPYAPGDRAWSIQSYQQGIGNTGAGNLLIHKSATPDVSAGTFDWTNVEAFEVHLRSSQANGNFDFDVFMCFVDTCGPATFTDGLTADRGALWYMWEKGYTHGSTRGWPWTSTLDGGTTSETGEIRRLWRRYESDTASALSQGYVGYHSLHMGDGTTLTEFEDSGFGVHWAMTRAAFESNVPDSDSGEWFWIIDNGTRAWQVNTTASCVNILSDFFLEGRPVTGGDWNCYVIGNSGATVTWTNFRVSYTSSTRLLHGTYTGGTFQGCEEIEVTTNTTFASCLMIDNSATSKGLYIDAAPGDYSGIDLTIFSSCAGDNITINPTTAGTYNLGGISVESGHTLTIHNESATHAITVEIPSGITTSTSTAGGTVTVSSPPVTYTLTNLVAGTEVRAYDGTNPATATVVDGVESSGTSFAFNLTSPGSAGYIQIHKTGYVYEKISLTWPTVNTTRAVNQQVDLNYSNP